MPKYYRFRATTPTRRVRLNKDNDKDKEVHKTETLERAMEDLLRLTLVCAAPPWYRRRTAWRERPGTLGAMRPLATATAAGQPVFLVKLRSPSFAI